MFLALHTYNVDSMQLKLPKGAVTNPLLVMRRAGYSAFVDPVSKEHSFVLRLTSAFYPRFHVYLEQEREHVIFSVHLDQKQPSYGEGHTHAGEYDGPTVEREIRRIASWANAVAREAHTETPEKNTPARPKKWTDWFWN